MPLLPITAMKQPGEYKAGALLKPEMVQGRLHRVDERVLHDGFLYHFTVQSSFGPYEVTSIPSLAVLIHELDASRGHEAGGNVGHRHAIPAEKR